MKFFNLKNIGLLTLIVIAFLLPLGISDYWQYVLTIVFFYTIMAASWNLLGGYTGQFSLAHHTFGFDHQHRRCVGSDHAKGYHKQG